MGPPDRAVEEVLVIRRRAGDEVAGVPRRVVAAGLNMSVQLFGARLGQDLDAAVSQLVELRGKRILIDTNLADRRLGRQVAAGKAVDVNLAAAVSRRGTGQRGQFVLHLVRIVGERVQILAAQHHGIAVVCRLRIQLPRVRSHLHLLLLRGDGQRNIQHARGAVHDRHARFRKRSEPCHIHIQRVVACRQRSKRVAAVAARCGGKILAAARQTARSHRARWRRSDPSPAHATIQFLGTIVLCMHQRCGQNEQTHIKAQKNGTDESSDS